MPARYQTDYQVGQDNLRKMGMDIHHPAFWVAAILILVFVLSTLMAPGPGIMSIRSTRITSPYIPRRLMP